MTFILSHDTDVFFILWERWDGSVLDTNATCPEFGRKCLQLPGMLSLSQCDTNAYPYGKGNATALKIMISGNFLGVTTLGDVGTTHTELVNAAMSFFVAVYSQPPGTSMKSAR